MPGNPIECRLYALRCSLLAKAAATLKSRRALLALAGTWKGLAAELESDQVFLQTISELEFSSQHSEPYEALPVALGLRSRVAFGVSGASRRALLLRVYGPIPGAVEAIEES